MKNNQKTTLIYFSIAIYLFISCAVKNKVRIPLEGNYCNWELLIDEEDINFLKNEHDNTCGNKIYLLFTYFPNENKIVKDSLMIICNSKKISNKKLNNYYMNKIPMKMENVNKKCNSKSKYIKYSVPLIFRNEEADKQ
tara:strand:- start:207 stop:620 length:414 start_codon:yes stop_codon:yes gene_type:complete